VSHNWVTLSPVDFAYSKAADGSASVTVGNRDRVYGMDWTVEVVLRPGSTVLEQHVSAVQSQRPAPSLLLVEQRRHRDMETIRESGTRCGLRSKVTLGQWMRKVSIRA